MAVCPVCNKAVDEKTTKFTSDYKGKKYYMLSEECKKQFDANPEKYLAPKKRAA